MIEYNKIYKKDNIDLLHELSDESIDLIYCDILYGTGRDFGQYKDIKASKDEIHDFYTPRIKEMYRVLKSTGSIYLQMDVKISHWLRNILDEQFGYENFKNEIIWKRCNSNKNNKLKFTDDTDRILFYSKSKKYTFNQVFDLETIEPYDIMLQKRGTDSNRNDRPNMFYPFYYNPETDHLTLVKIEGYLEILPIDNNGNEKRWEWGYDKSQKDIDKLFIRNIKGNLKVYRKSKDEKKIPLDCIWTDKLVNYPIYPTEKPESLLRKIILASSNKDDIVADFFCGSGTTMVAAKQMERNYVGCDVNSLAVEIANERINNTNVHT